MAKLPDGRIRFDAGELPPVAMSLGSTAWNKTGAWRSREPSFQDQRPPCSAKCPIGEDIADQLRLVAQGRLREAGEVMLSANPFPAVTGRVCPHPCTSACNRGQMEGAVDVPGLERAIGDALLRERASLPRARANGGRVSVVGAGPAGLSAACYLASAGFTVRLFDRELKPGGLLWSGIPPYRLPREVVDGEVARALEGVKFEGGRALGKDLRLEGLKHEADAVIVAVGRHAARGLGVPGAEARGVVDGLGLLAAVHRGEPLPAGERVVVVGGGNTALDCARTLLRAGRKVTVAYRRGRAAMPAFAEEIEEALEEGVALLEWAIPKRVVVRGGSAAALECLRARPGAPDASGRPRPEPVPGSEVELPAELVVVAAGEELDPASVPESLVRDGAVAVSDDLKASLPWVWAVGDCTGSTGTVAEAIGQGRRAAALVAQALGAPGPLVDPVAARGGGGEVVPFERIRVRYYAPAPPLERGRRAAGERLRGGEVREPFSGDAARAEASRCLSCGTCTGCDNCFTYCGDRAVVRGAPGRYAVDVSRCKGCGVCVEECPRGAVQLRELGGE